MTTLVAIEMYASRLMRIFLPLHLSTITFCHLLHVYSRTGCLYPLFMWSLWCVQMPGYIMAFWKFSLCIVSLWLIINRICPFPRDYYCFCFSPGRCTSACKITLTKNKDKWEPSKGGVYIVAHTVNTHVREKQVYVSWNAFFVIKHIKFSSIIRYNLASDVCRTHVKAISAQLPWQQYPWVSN